MTAPHITAITLGVRDVTASRRFYVDGLGFEGSRPPPTTSPSSAPATGAAPTCAEMARRPFRRH